MIALKEKIAKHWNSQKNDEQQNFFTFFSKEPEKAKKRGGVEEKIKLKFFWEYLGGKDSPKEITFDY